MRERRRPRPPGPPGPLPPALAAGPDPDHGWASEREWAEAGAEWAREHGYDRLGWRTLLPLEVVLSVGALGHASRRGGRRPPWEDDDR